MPETLVGKATTNSIANSVTTIQIKELVCNLTIEPNAFGDILPIIPNAARTSRNKILYQLKIRARVTRYIDGGPVVDFKLSIHSNRSGDKIEFGGSTNKEGEITITLSTREPGELYLHTNSPSVTMPKFTIKLQEA